MKGSERGDGGWAAQCGRQEGGSVCMCVGNY